MTEAQITLSFDHRSLDGGGAGRLLKRVIELLEDPAKLCSAGARVLVVGRDSRPSTNL